MPTPWRSSEIQWGVGGGGGRVGGGFVMLEVLRHILKLNWIFLFYMFCFSLLLQLGQMGQRNFYEKL